MQLIARKDHYVIFAASQEVGVVFRSSPLKWVAKAGVQVATGRNALDAFNRLMRTLA